MVQKVSIFLGAILLFSCNPEKSQTDKRLTAPYASEPIQINGDLDDWPDAPQLVLTDRDGLSQNVLRICSAWDHENLYLGFDVSDSDLRAFQTEKDHKKLFLDDMVEFLIDTRLDRSEKWLEDDIIYHINLLGQKKDDRGTPQGESDPTWDGDAMYAIRIRGTLNDTTDVDSGYTLEVAVPWVELNREPKADLAMGLNFACGDNDGKGRMLFDWVGAWPMRSPHAFGTLVLHSASP